MLGRSSRLALVVAFVVLPAALVGGAGATTNIAQARELNIMGFGPGDDIANNRAAIAKDALPSGTDVDNPRGAFDDQKFLAALAARNVPDVVYLDRNRVAQYAAKGAFVPLTSCVKNQKINLKQYRKAALREVTYKGKLYALPEFTSQRVLIINNDAVRAAGLKPSDISTKNWSKLARVNKRLLKRDGGKVTRIGFDPKIPEFFPLWAKANGANLLSNDGLHARLNDPKAVQALTFAVSLIKAHGGWGPFKSFRDTWDFFGKKNQVAENQIGAWPMESWYFQVLASSSPNVSITTKPFQKKNGAPITFFTGSGWAIPKGAKDADLACTWMKTMTTSQTWLRVAKIRFDARRARGQPFTGLYTANAVADRKIYEDIYQPMGNRDFDEAVKQLVNVQKYAFAMPPSPAGFEVQTAWTDAINRVLAGQQSPRAALNQAQREAQRAINKAK